MIVETVGALDNCRAILERAYEEPKKVYDRNRHLNPEAFDKALRDSLGLLRASDQVAREVYAGRKTLEDYRASLRPWWKFIMRRFREAAAEESR